MNKDIDEELSPSQGGIRRSSRNRVPNPIYKEGIKELKRGLNRNGKSKDEDSNPEEDDRDSYKGSVRSDEGDWLKCALENADGSSKDLWVSIKLTKPIEMAKKESFVKPKLIKTRDTEKKTQEDSRKNRKKSIVQELEPPAEKGMGLYQLLMNAAKKALAHNTENQISEQMPSEQGQQSQVPIRSKKETKQEREGKLLGVQLTENKIVFQHSKHKTIQVQMKPEPLKASMSTERPSYLSNGMSIEEIQQIFENHKKNVYRSSIFL